MRKLYATLIFITTGIFAQAQDRPIDSLANLAKKDTAAHVKHHSHFEMALDYQSNSVYMGRKDSTTLPYFIPTLSYYHKSGFYISASAAYLKNSDASRIDLVTIGSGFKFSAGKYEGDVTASKYFYNSQSTSVTAAIEASLSYYNSYDFGFIRTIASGQLNIGTRSDLGAAFGLEHAFELLDDALEITPSFTANAGTLNYYSNYYKTRRFNRKKAKKPVSGTVTITGTVVNPSAFTILDYEASLPLSYIAGKWTFSFTPVYAMAVNPARIDLHYVYSTGTTADRQHVESIGNTFFWTLGISRRF
jgi:hypothetical protein